MNFLELAKNRYSCRAYKSLDVEKEKLDYILECVRFAPSAVNKQPWLFHKSSRTKKNPPPIGYKRRNTFFCCINNYCLRSVIPACMPFTLFINEVTVCRLAFVELAPKVLNRLRSLVASVTNCKSFPSI